MATYKNLEDYPIVLQAKHVKEILGISTGATYALLKSASFPTIHLGEKRMVVTREKFSEWLGDSMRSIKRIPIITVGRK